MVFFTELEQIISQFVWKYKKTSNSQSNLKKKEWNWRNQAGIKIAGRDINHLRHADDTTLMAESEEELKRLLMKGKEESEKVGLKLNI